MKVLYDGIAIPYPLHLLVGKMKMIGLDGSSISELIDQTILKSDNATITYSDFQTTILKYLSSYPDSERKFKLLLEFEKKLKSSDTVSPLVLVLEGSSATGKSMLCIPLMERLGITRFLSTDSIRQLLRTLIPEREHPELFCHTYQAHRYALSGNSDLDPAVRGFIAQVELMNTTLSESLHRFIDEGTSALLEGVHILPGSFIDVNDSIFEVLIHPSEPLHSDMFLVKSEASGLTTVSSNRETRSDEFEKTRMIQNHMCACAKSSGVPIIEFRDYESALSEIQELIFKHVTKIVQPSH